MHGVSVAPRPTRTHYRHELRTLTYVTLDEANGGIIRNLNSEGVAVQAVAALRQQQRVRLRFELRFPRLRVETYGQVSWADPSGQCGIRFVDLPTRTGRQIDEWIFSNLLGAIARDAGHPRSILGASVVSISRNENVREENIGEEDAAEANDGLTLSASPRPAIRLGPARLEPDAAEPAAAEQAAPEPGLTGQGALLPQQSSADDFADLAENPYAQSWLSQPLSGRTLAWLVDSLIVIAGVLVFALIFLSIAHELPPWPLTLGTASAAAVFVATAYWGVFAVFGGPSLGERLAQATASVEGEKEREGASRFR
jgi:hypothetical protein